MRKFQLLIPVLLAALLAGFVGRGFLHRDDYAVASGAARDPASAFTDGRPNLVGAMFYSAWCSSCGILDPKLRRVTPGFEGRAVEFVKFDFSMGQPETLTQKAAGLGVDRVYLANKGATGFMALIDRRTQSVVGTISMRQTDEEIADTIEAAIKTASRPVS